MTAAKKKTAAVGADRAEYHHRRRRRPHRLRRHRPRLYRRRRKRLDLRCLSSRRRRLPGDTHHTHEPRVIMPPYLETIIIYAV